ncbi:MAG: hypothetical protein ACRD0P_22565, partial [Stackebrandtia sp.]
MTSTKLASRTAEEHLTTTSRGGHDMIGGKLPQFDIRPHPHPKSAAERAEILANPGFGRYFT